MMQGDRLVLSGFGSFETKVRAARRRNPRTGEMIESKATLPVFKAGRTLKDKVNAKMRLDKYLKVFRASSSGARWQTTPAMRRASR